MYLDHPKISATNSNTEPDRIERLNRVYGYALAVADLAASMVASRPAFCGCTLLTI